MSIARRISAPSAARHAGRHAGRLTIVAFTSFALGACADGPTAPVQREHEELATAPVAQPQASPRSDSTAKSAGETGSFRISATNVQTSLTTATTCKAITTTYTIKNALGQMVKQTWMQTNFCYSAGRVTSVSIPSKGHDSAYLWFWDSWTGVGAQNYGTYAIAKTTGGFKECAQWCFNSDALTIKVTVRGDGTFTAAKSS